jgi:hypothetical protein
MLDQHKSHLLSAYTAALQRIEEIRRVAMRGESPSGTPLTPLPGEECQQLLALLNLVSGQLHQALAAVLPDLEGGGSPAPLSATRMWVNILLRGLHASLADLQPERISRRYGALDQAAAAALGPAVSALLQELSRAIDELHRPPGRKQPPGR